MKIWAVPSKDFKVKKTSVKNGYVTADWKKVVRDDGEISYEVKVSLAGPVKETGEDEIVIWTNDKEQSKIVVPVRIEKAL